MFAGGSWTSRISPARDESECPCHPFQRLDSPNVENVSYITLSSTSSPTPPMNTVFFALVPSSIEVLWKVKHVTRRFGRAFPSPDRKEHTMGTSTPNAGRRVWLGGFRRAECISRRHPPCCPAGRPILLLRHPQVRLLSHQLTRMKSTAVSHLTGHAIVIS